MSDATKDNRICDFVQASYRHSVILSTKEQIKLLKQYRQARGERNKTVLREKLVSTLWKYAVKEADKFKHIIDELTARQAAYIGLITTLDKYRINSGSALTTCMFWRVKLELIRTIYKVKYQIHLPEYLYTKIKKLIEKRCSYEDITRMTSIELANFVFGENATHAQIRKMEVFMQTGVPIDLDVNERGSNTNVPAYKEEGYGLVEIRTDVNRAILKALRTQKFDDRGKPIFSSYKLKLPNGKSEVVKIPDHVIDMRDYDVVCMYYGINGRYKCGLKEIGQEYKMTRERVRQIRDKVHLILKDFLEGYGED